MIRRFDKWFGETLFVPLIIRLCQRTGLTQYAVHAYGWFIIILSILYEGPAETGWAFYIFYMVFGVIWILICGLTPNLPRQETQWIRLMFIFSLAIDLLICGIGLAFGKAVAGLLVPIGRSWLALFAEYALTIKTIPPLEAKERKRKLVEQKI